MKVIYKDSVADRLEAAITEAKANHKEISHIEITRHELMEIGAFKVYPEAIPFDPNSVEHFNYRGVLIVVDDGGSKYV